MPTAKTARTTKSTPAAARARQVPAKVMKLLGLQRIDAFRAADLTPQLREKAGLTPEDEHRLTAAAELSRLGIPAAAAEALAFSGALGGASELAALTVEELERVVQEDPVKRLLPSNFHIDRAILEGWVTVAVPLTADENAPGRSAVAETGTVTMNRDEELSLAAEELPLASDRLQDILGSLRQTWSRTDAALAALARPAAPPVEGTALRAALAELQGGIAEAIGRALTPASGEPMAADEETAAGVMDEDLEPAVEIVRLRDEMARLEATIGALQEFAATGLEESSPAAATETALSERETSERGE